MEKVEWTDLCPWVFETCGGTHFSHLPVYITKKQNKKSKIVSFPSIIWLGTEKDGGSNFRLHFTKYLFPPFYLLKTSRI